MSIRVAKTAPCVIAQLLNKTAISSNHLYDASQIIPQDIKDLTYGTTLYADCRCIIVPA